MIFPHCCFPWLQCFHCCGREQLNSKEEKPEEFPVQLTPAFPRAEHATGTTVHNQYNSTSAGITWCAVCRPGSDTETCATTETIVCLALLAIAQGAFLELG